MVIGGAEGHQAALRCWLGGKQMSGRSRWRSMPVTRSTSTKRSAGTLSHMVGALVEMPSSLAILASIPRLDRRSGIPVSVWSGIRYAKHD